MLEKDVPLYDLGFAFSTDEKSLCEKFELQPCGGLGWSTFYKKHIIMWIGESEDLSTLCHECFHAAMQVCKSAGIKIDVENDEAAAYLAGWFFKEAHTYLNLRKNTPASPS